MGETLVIDWFPFARVTWLELLHDDKSYQRKFFTGDRKDHKGAIGVGLDFAGESRVID